MKRVHWNFLAIQSSSNLGKMGQQGADSGFLKRGFICIKVLGFALLILSHFSLISHENEIIWSH